jgi:hypothetical protein
MQPLHTTRYALLTAFVLAGLVIAGLIDTALAVVVVIMALGFAVLILPFVVIHFDEHEERLQRHGPGAHA